MTTNGQVQEETGGKDRVPDKGEKVGMETCLVYIPEPDFSALTEEQRKHLKCEIKKRIKELGPKCQLGDSYKRFYPNFPIPRESREDPFPDVVSVKEKDGSVRKLIIRPKKFRDYDEAEINNGRCKFKLLGPSVPSYLEMLGSYLPPGSIPERLLRQPYRPDADVGHTSQESQPSTSKQCSSSTVRSTKEERVAKILEAIAAADKTVKMEDEEKRRVIVERRAALKAARAAKLAEALAAIRNGDRRVTRQSVKLNSGCDPQVDRGGHLNHSTTEEEVSMSKKPCKHAFTLALGLTEVSSSPKNIQAQDPASVSTHEQQPAVPSTSAVVTVDIDQMSISITTQEVTLTASEQIVHVPDQLELEENVNPVSSNTPKRRKISKKNARSIGVASFSSVTVVTAPKPPKKPEGYFPHYIGWVEGDKWEVERLVGSRFQVSEHNVKKIEYMVRWKGWGIKYDSWVKEANLGAPNKLKEYWRSVLKKIKKVNRPNRSLLKDVKPKLELHLTLTYFEF